MKLHRVKVEGLLQRQNRDLRRKGKKQEEDGVSSAGESEDRQGTRIRDLGGGGCPACQGGALGI